MWPRLKLTVIEAKGSNETVALPGKLSPDKLPDVALSIVIEKLRTPVWPGGTVMFAVEHESGEPGGGEHSNERLTG